MRMRGSQWNQLARVRNAEARGSIPLCSTNRIKHLRRGASSSFLFPVAAMRRPRASTPFSTHRIRHLRRRAPRRSCFGAVMRRPWVQSLSSQPIESNAYGEAASCASVRQCGGQLRYPTPYTKGSNHLRRGPSPAFLFRLPNRCQNLGHSGLK